MAKKPAPSPRVSALALSKKINDVKSLVFVKGNEDAKKLLVAWTLFKPTFEDFDLPASHPPESAFGLLWLKQEPVDFERLGRIAGLPYLLTHRLFHRLVGAFLIYPDGSISTNASIFVTSEIQGYLRELYVQSGQKPITKAP